MYAKDIKVGMKVVPVIRTIEGALSTSDEWKGVLKDTRKKEKFLYVIDIVEKKGQKPTFLCASKKSADEGDLFNTIDGSISTNHRAALDIERCLCRNRLHPRVR